MHARRGVITRVPIGALVTVLVVTVVLTSPASSQSQTGTLLGLIHNAQNQGVADVQVRLLPAEAQPNSSTPSQLVFHTVTDTAGRFHFVGLPSGVYSLELSRSGWQSWRVSHLYVREASTLDVSILLLPLKQKSFQQANSFHLFDRSVWVGRRFGQFSLFELPTTMRVWSILENQDTS